MSTTPPLIRIVDTIEELQKRIKWNDLKLEAIEKKIKQLQNSLLEISYGSS
jgi:hypothetical protein